MHLPQTSFHRTICYISLLLPNRGGGQEDIEERGVPISDFQDHSQSRSLLKEQACHYLQENLKTNAWASGQQPSWETHLDVRSPGKMCLTLFILASREPFRPDVVLTGYGGKVRLTTGFLQLTVDYAEGGSWESMCRSGLQGGPPSAQAPASLCLEKRRAEQGRT